MHLVSPEIEHYIEQHASEEAAILKQLNRETYVKVQMPNMLSGHIQGQFLQMISQMIRPKRVLEIGTFTGYSAICLAKGLEQNGILYTIDINEELQPMVARYFEASGISNHTKQLIGDASQIISSITEIFDLVFIDADKSNYCNYYDLVFDKVRVGGYIIADNVLWSGKVVSSEKDKDTLAIDNYNKKIAKDYRVEQFILPLRDGLNIARKLS